VPCLQDRRPSVDLVFVLSTILFFLAMWAYTAACERV
jgi:hypothetical protein